MSLEQNLASPENEKNISDIVKTLESRAWFKTLMTESIGGNAGANRAGINAFVDRESGKIVQFGNLQDIDPAVRNNPAYGEASFLYDFGTSFTALRKNLEPEEIVPEHFVAVYGDSISKQALSNLNESIARYNETLKEEQSRNRE